MKRWLIMLLVLLPAALLTGLHGNAQNDDYWVLTNTSVDGKSGGKQLKIKKNVATHSSGTTLTWTNPPQKIKVGHETDIVLRYQKEWGSGMSDAIKRSTLLGIGVTVLGDGFTFSLFPQDGGLLQWDGQIQRLSSYGTNTMYVTLQVNGTPNAANLGHTDFVTQTWVYKRYGSGNTREETTIAGGDEGEEKEDSEIPWDWIIPGGIILIGGGAISRKRKNKKGEKKPKEKTAIHNTSSFGDKQTLLGT